MFQFLNLLNVLDDLDDDFKSCIDILTNVDFLVLLRDINLIYLFFYFYLIFLFYVKLKWASN